MLGQVSGPLRWIPGSSIKRPQNELTSLFVALVVVASLVGDTEVEEASEYLYERGIVAYPYTTETPVEVLGAKYRWARNAGLL